MNEAARRGSATKGAAVLLGLLSVQAMAMAETMAPTQPLRLANMPIEEPRTFSEALELPKGNVNTTAFWVSGCSNPRSVSSRAMCIGYMISLNELRHYMRTMHNIRLFCPPAGVGPIDYFAAIMSVVDKNPKMMKMPFGVSAILALEVVYPCPAQTKPKGSQGKK